MAEASDRQARHYDRILSDYDRHYYDAQSSAYRERFIIGPLVEGLDLNGLEVADLALRQRRDFAVAASALSGRAADRFRHLAASLRNLSGACRKAVPMSST